MAVKTKKVTVLLLVSSATVHVIKEGKHLFNQNIKLLYKSGYSKANGILEGCNTYFLKYIAHKAEDILADPDLIIGMC